MVKTACPTNFLAARENYQVAKYKLRRTEDQLFANFGVTTVADLEQAMLQERSKSQPRFAALTTLYFQQHQELGAADETYEMARDLQRERVQQMKKFDTTIKALDE